MLIKNLSYLCLIGVISLGLITIVGSNGGEDSASNSTRTSDTTSDTTEAAVATVGHSGFDFSTEEAGGDYEAQDGYPTAWVPGNSEYPEGYEWGSGVRWVPYTNTDTENFTKDMGEVELGSVTSVPDTWDGGTGQSVMPLQVGHVYVVKCREGYAKSLVNSISSESWDVQVEYYFTSGTAFEQQGALTLKASTAMNIKTLYHPLKY